MYWADGSSRRPPLGTVPSGIVVYPAPLNVVRLIAPAGSAPKASVTCCRNDSPLCRLIVTCAVFGAARPGLA